MVKYNILNVEQLKVIITIFLFSIRKFTYNYLQKMN